MNADKNEIRENQARRVFETALIVVLSVHVLLFFGFKRLDVDQKDRDVRVNHVFDVINTPATDIERPKPPPKELTIPVPSDDETLPADYVFEETPTFDPNPSPPPPPIDFEPYFEPIEQMPEPLGGYSALTRLIQYPELARQAGIEGRVLVAVYIDKDGRVLAAKIMKSLGPSGCDEAAIKAVKTVQWKPGMQRDIPVKVWVSVPVDFKLTRR